MDFAGGVAFPSDQGLFIAPTGDQASDTALINANGNMSNNIAIRVAVSRGDGVERYLVMTVWDWNVIASWDSGKHWPATPCSYWDAANSCQGAPAAIGEGGLSEPHGIFTSQPHLRSISVVRPKRGLWLAGCAEALGVSVGRRTAVTAATRREGDGQRCYAHFSRS